MRWSWVPDTHACSVLVSRKCCLDTQTIIGMVLSECSTRTWALRSTGRALREIPLD